MKHELSAMSLIARPTLIIFAVILLLMSICQYFIFSSELNEAIADYDFNVKNFTDADIARGYLSPASKPFEEVVDQSGIKYVLAGAFVLICILFAANGGGIGSGRIDYTLRRLPISEERIHIMWAVYFTLCFMILLAWQAATLLIFMSVYAASPLGFIFHGQSLFLATWRCDLLHNVMPVGNLLVLARNIILCASLGITASCFSYRLRRGTKFPLSFPLLMSFGMTTFLGEYSWVELPIIGICFSLVTLFFAVSNARGDRYDG